MSEGDLLTEYFKTNNVLSFILNLSQQDVIAQKSIEK